MLTSDDMTDDNSGEPTNPTSPIVVEPLPELASWQRALQNVASAPLQYCPNLPQIAQRFEAWWAQDMHDRPVLIASTNAAPQRTITRRLELIHDPAEWLDAKFLDMVSQHWVGDALPHVRVDFGPVMLGGLLGAPIEFSSDTTWTHAFINDEWTNEPDWMIHDDNPLWRQLHRLLRLVSRDATGRYLLRTPSLGGGADVLLNLRGSTELCMDTIEQPQRIQRALEGIYVAWRRAFTELYGIASEHNVGLLHWIGLWSSQPYVVPECDFSFMVGPNEFEKLLLPDIARQAATVGRAVFHLDGPGSARHIDALLEIPELTGIQFTPGAGAPSALAWVPMFEKILHKGRSVLVFCPPEEVLALSEALPGEGVAIFVEGQATPQELDTIFAQFCRRFGG